MLRPFRLRLSAAAFALLMIPALAFAQTNYVFTKIADNETPRPDGLGNFYLGTVQVNPALDGNVVTFQDVTSNDNSLWSYNVSSGAFTKLVSFQTPVPNGVGNFTRFNDQTGRPKDGLFFFEGLDNGTGPRNLHGGIYTVPVGGGAISKVVDYKTAAPAADGPFISANGGNMLTGGFNDGDFDYEAGVIAFHGLTDSAGDGIYSVHTDGTSLIRLADKHTEGTPGSFPVGQYFTAALHNHTAVFHGATVFGPYGLFSSPETGGLSSPTLLTTPQTTLPGGQSPENTTAYYTGLSHFDHVTGKYVFAAKDGSGVNGLYSLPADGLGGGVITKIVDNHTALPGAAIPAEYFDGFPFSTDGGQVAFITPTNNSANQVGALYVANADGTITRVIGVNDVLDGINIVNLTLNAHALSNGQIVFGAGSYLQGHDGNPRYGAIFLATPAAQTANLALTLSPATANATVGENVTYKVTVVNNGPLAEPSATVVNTLPAGTTFVSATSGATLGNAGVIFTSGSMAVGESASFDVTINVTTAGSLVSSAIATGAIPDADTADNTAQAVVNAVDLPIVTVVATTPTVTNGTGGKGVFTLTLSSPSATDLNVIYTVKGNAMNGVDYTFLKGHAKIKAGKTTKAVKVKPLGDGEGLDKLKVKFTLQPGDGYRVGTTTPAKVKILEP